ncbi:MAG: B12-binding domain-containing radical SAM protein, partial [Clostridiaceae bacterium]|nr:B12-binding domain-containing radical SAM protein [Clostridiaceae bacterium]
MKIRFLEPGNQPYRKSPLNYFVYDKYIRTPSHGLMTLAAIVKRVEEDVLIYSESISKINWSDVFEADVIFISIFTFNAIRGYELAEHIRRNSRATVVIGGLHATLNYAEAASHCDYVLVGEGDETILKLLRSIKSEEKAAFAGIAYYVDEQLIFTGRSEPPADIDVIPARGLLHNYRKMAGHSTVWPQVHASRGCPHKCDYCALVHAFGRGVRTRSPQNVVSDIKEAI